MAKLETTPFDERMFGTIGAVWVMLGVPLLIVWFGFADDPWATLPYTADLTNPVQLIEACIFYGPPVLLGVLLLRLKFGKAN